MPWSSRPECIPVVTMKRDAGAVRIDWDAIPDAQEYIIDIHLADTVGLTLLVMQPSVVLRPHGHFRILPVFASGVEGSWSDWFALSERMNPMEPITADRPITATLNNTRLHLAWPAVPEATGYELQTQGDESIMTAVFDTHITVLADEWAGKAVRVRPFFKTPALVGNWSDWYSLSVAPSPQLHLYNVNVYSCRQELITYLYCAHFVTAETWQSLDMLGFDPVPIAQSVMFAGPFAVNDGHNPHPLTGAVAWLSAFSNLPQRRYAIGAAAQLFAGASVAELEAYVTLWQGTIYDARVIP